MPKWVDLVGYDVQARAFKPVARAIMLDDGAVRLEGPDKVIASLQVRGVESPLTGDVSFPSDGDAFLSALQAAFTNPMLMQATDTQQGTAPPPPLS